MNSKSRKYLVQFLLTFLCLSVYSDLFSQKKILSKSRIIDSLTHLITKQKADSNKVSTLISLAGQQTRIGEYDSAITTAYRAKLCAESAGFTKGIGNSLSMIGIGHYYKGEFANALSFYTLANKEFEKAGYKKGIANMLNNIGGIYSKLGDLPNALDYELKALKMNEEIGNQESAAYANVLNVIGVIYKNQMSYDKSLDYYTRSL